ncbi:putative ABC transporter ATP-binding protein [Moraxella macacae 0408225]|uniref:Putative ABC transporter ATP-binding protein n=1 Tax=Moraxella macacae 0408225 TaxID=1230338 RepID=L2F589_9GAMM|nr:ATP-binding cassette domain-containing protein [Moraxella macacae]ELA08187.1 putative ABC transporter ATP-binding protein [Moraxella macacae 0408225]
MNQITIEAPLTPINQGVKSPLILQKSDCQKVMICQNATMHFGQRVLWQAINFEILAGEFVALLGANGTGKTTLFHSILGLKRLTQGNIHLTSGVKIGYVPQLKNFDPKLPIRGRDLVQLGLDGESYLFGRFSPKKLFGVHWLSTKQKNYRINKAIDEVGGHAFADIPLHLLSGGEQQRMRIAQALVAEPDLLLLDEPLLSLDVASQYVVCDILLHRKTFHNTAILMISHELAPIKPLVDKVVFLKDSTAKVGDVALLQAYQGF